MDLLDLLRPSHVVVPLEATDLRAAIDALVVALEQAGAIDASEQLHRRIREEPLRDAIAVGEEAVLHGYRSDAAPSLTMALGVATEPLATGDRTLEARPRLVAVVLAPQEAASPYLQATSTLIRLLREPDVVESLLDQTTADGLLALPQLRDRKVQPSLTVRDVMVHRTHAVAPDASVRSVLDLMLRRRLHAVPVVGKKGEVLGLVTEGDVMRVLLPTIPRAGADEATTDDEPGERPVREVMARSVLCVSDDLGVSEVASMMINKDVEQVPVVNAGVMTGMVSRTDIIRKLFGRG